MLGCSWWQSLVSDIQFQIIALQLVYETQRTRATYLETGDNVLGQIVLF